MLTNALILSSGVAPYATVFNLPLHQVLLFLNISIGTAILVSFCLTRLAKRIF